jgi:hypothetical protein
MQNNFFRMHFTVKYFCVILFLFFYDVQSQNTSTIIESYFVDVRVIFQNISNISGVCTNVTQDMLNCSSENTKKFHYIISDGRLSLNDIDFQLLQTGKFITENNFLILNTPVTAILCEPQTCLYRHAGLTLDTIWQPVSRNESFLLFPKSPQGQKITIPIFAQAVSQYYDSNDLKCLRIQSDKIVSIIAINGKSIIPGSHNITLPQLDDKTGLYNYFYRYESFLIEPGNDSPILKLTVQNPSSKNELSLQFFAQVTSVDGHCFLQYTTPTSTQTTTQTTSSTTTQTTTLPPVCGFKTNIPSEQSYAFGAPPNNGDSPCGVHAQCQGESTCGGHTILYWAQPNQAFFGPITTQCPTGTQCSQAEQIGVNGQVNAGFEQALCQGRPIVFLVSPNLVYDYESTKNGCTASNNPTPNIDNNYFDESCLCEVDENGEDRCESPGGLKWEMHAYRCK